MTTFASNFIYRLNMAVEKGQKEARGRITFVQCIPFILLHLLPLGMIWTGATFFDWMICIGLYFGRMFFITAGYHRYFAHKSFETSRWFQFFLAFMAQTSIQKGVLWWAANHRGHHLTSDTPEDPHSMKVYGFWYSHIGWFLGPDYNETKFDKIKEFSKFKELVWLNKYFIVPPVVLALVAMMFGGIVNGNGVADMFSNAGFSTLYCGFCFSTIILFHGTYSINSIMHYFGKQRYKTGDESRNHFLLAFFTMGEGWHNNHHYFQSSAKAGFFWWQLDMTYYILKSWSWIGLVKNLRGVPDAVRYSTSRSDIDYLRNNPDSLIERMKN